MDYEDDEPDREFEEFLKATRGHRKTPRNPKGAGRPSRTAEEYREFLAWKEAKKAGILQPLGELIGRVAGRGETGDSRSTKTSGRGLIQRVLSLIFEEKEIKKMKFDKVDEGIERTYKHLAPWVMPVLLKPAAIVAGLSLLYGLEHWVRWTYTFSVEEYANLDEYYKKGFISCEKVGDEYKCVRKVLPQFLHSIVYIIKWAIDAIKEFIEQEYGIAMTDPWEGIQKGLASAAEGDYYSAARYASTAVGSYSLNPLAFLFKTLGGFFKKEKEE
ncbi:MAG: hypothetical protein ACTSR2_04950 [Candidatus Hodarchaeales archaeon]